MPKKTIKQKKKTVPELSGQALKRLKGIHKLSLEYNQLKDTPHTKKLFSLMRKHIKEIEELYKKKDGHFLVETGDLLILCFEMLIEHNCSIDATLKLCFNRYEKKLNSLIKELK